MKKTIAVLAVLLIALVSVFAGNKAEIYAGGNVGFSFQKHTNAYTLSKVAYSFSTKESDLQLAATGEYYFTENMGVAASFGVNVPMSASYVEAKVAGVSQSLDQTCNPKTGIVAAIDFAYKYAVDKKIDVIGKAGFGCATAKDQKRSSCKSYG